MSSNRPGQFGRRPGVYAVPFKKELLPGVTFVTACVRFGEAIAAVKESAVSTAVRQNSRTDRHTAVDLFVKRAARGALKGLDPAKIIVTGEDAYSTRQTAAAIVRAIELLRENDNEPQAIRYRDRVRGEVDRALGNGRAGENVIGWTDATVVNRTAGKRATPADVARATEAQAARSGENSPYAVFVARLKAEAEAEEKAAAAAARKRSRAAGSKRGKGDDADAGDDAGTAVRPVKPKPVKPSASGARRRPAKGEGDSDAGSPAKPTRPSRKGR